MPCTENRFCLAKDGRCPAVANISKYETCKDERARVQLQVFEILMSDEKTGKRIESTPEEKADAVEFVAPIFASAYARGFRCPEAIARIVGGHSLGVGFEMAAR